jgi:TolA-binding protein
MNPLTVRSILTCLVLVFLAGGTVGALIARKQSGHSTVKEPSMEKASHRMQDKIVSRLGLTQDQIRQMQPVFEQTTTDLRAIHAKALRESDDAIRRAHQHIAPHLTPEQLTRLEAIEAERRDWMERRSKERDCRSAR